MESAAAHGGELCVLGWAGCGDGAGGGRDLCTVSGLVEAVFRIAMACEDDNLVAPVLQSHSGIYYQPLGTANAKIWMEKDNCLLLCRRCRLCHPALELAQFGIPVYSGRHVGERTCKCIPALRNMSLRRWAGHMSCHGGPWMTKPLIRTSTTLRPHLNLTLATNTCEATS